MHQSIDSPKPPSNFSARSVSRSPGYVIVSKNEKKTVVNFSHPTHNCTGPPTGRMWHPMTEIGIRYWIIDRSQTWMARHDSELFQNSSITFSLILASKARPIALCGIWNIIWETHRCPRIPCPFRKNVIQKRTNTFILTSITLALADPAPFTSLLSTGERRTLKLPPLHFHRIAISKW